jgi:hypothetical protein
MRSFIYKIMPFIVLGITLFILIAGIIILSYVLIFGALIGLILFAVNWLRDKLSPKGPPVSKKVEKEGRIIDHDDINKP